VTIQLKGVGGAPLLKLPREKPDGESKSLTKVTIDEDEPFSKLISLVRNLLGKSKEDSLFLILKSGFTPCPREKIGVLADAFGSIEVDRQTKASVKTLTVQYALVPAWG
jgi:hypothetical protein